MLLAFPSPNELKIELFMFCFLFVKATAIQCLPSSSSVIIGTEDGALILVDITTPEHPRPVLRRLLHKGRITALGCVIFICFPQLDTPDLSNFIYVIC